MIGKNVFSKSKPIIIVIMLLLTGIFNVMASQGVIIHTIDAPDYHCRDLAWDGTYLWICDLVSDKIYKIDPETGDKKMQFNSPGNYPQGLTWDGTYLWNSDAGDPWTDKIYKINPSTGTKLETLDAPSGCYAQGLAWDGSYLWLADASNDKIWKLNPDNGYVVSSIEAPENPNGLTWEGTYLWVAGTDTDTHYLLDPSDGEIIDYIPHVASQATGLTWDGDYLWMNDGNTDEIYQVEIISSGEIELFPDSHDFENIPIGDCSSEYPFTLENIGEGTATGTISLIGTNADQYVITLGGGEFSLEAGETKTIKVKFCPTSEGLKTATLLADGDYCNDFSADLSGTGKIIQSPIADFTWSPGYPEPDEPISFDASESYDPDGTIELYEWNFGDGYIGSGQIVLHTYDEEGEYEVTLKVTDDDGAYQEKIKTISVIESYYFIHLTDTHVGTTGGLWRYNYVKDHILNNFEEKPKFIVISGDLTHWGYIPWKNPVFWWASFNFVTQEFNNNGIDVYLCMGDHDHFPILAPDLPDEGVSFIPENNLQLFKLESGGTADFIEGWRRIWPLPIWLPILDWIPEGSGLNPEQINWLSARLNEGETVYPSRLKTVFMHHPVFCDKDKERYINDFDETIANGCIMNYRNYFIGLCRNEVDIVLSGHLHHPREYLWYDGNTPGLVKLSKQTEPDKDDYMGYHGAPHSGYWSVSDLKQKGYDTPVQVITGACSKNLEYRIIQVKGDDIRIYDETVINTGDENLVDYQMDVWQIILPFKGGGQYPLDEDINAAARLHLYDSSGNHIGINEIGEIDDEIPDAYYEDEPVFNETTGEWIDWTETELINVLCDEDESFTYEIEGIMDCKLNLEGNIKLADGGGVISTFYNEVEFYEGSVGKIYINDGSDNYNLYIWDGGGEPRVVPPSNIMFPPEKPSIPSGPLFGKKGVSYTYITSTTDPDGDQLYYWFDWGDGSCSGPVGPFNSGYLASAEHIWSDPGIYEIKVMASDSTERISAWSEPLQVIIYHGFSGCIEGTQVTMTSTGISKQIQDVQIGDLILSYDPITRDLTTAEVTEVLEYTENLPECLIFNGNLEVTPEHTIFINGLEWLEANDTHVGDLMLENIPGDPTTNLIPIISINPSPIPVRIYDLVIQPITGEASGYWANGILVGG